jgi:protein phosphatase 1 regulatory subunit 37
VRSGLGMGQASPMSTRHRRHMRGTSLEISSPNFSIGDSDGDSDAEEVDLLGDEAAAPKRDSGRLPDTPHPARGNSTSPAKRAGLSDLRLEAADEAEQALREAAISSPVERVGKAWMEEEGEVFRKGARLNLGTGLGEDEEEGGGEVDEGMSGEVLRQEVSDF